MVSSERLYKYPDHKEQITQFARLRRSIHQRMKAEEEIRLSENPQPTEQELYMGAFNEWLEPQVRYAVNEMYRKGYATQSSGFHGEQPYLQMIDGYFAIDPHTQEILQTMGVEVLRGPDLGLPRNKLITMLRFRATKPDLGAIKAKWDAVAAALPDLTFPKGVRSICDRAEEFRLQYAPERPSFDQAREKYYQYLRTRVSH